MSKKLVIAEKPSVAADIARALGGFTRQGEWFESDVLVVCSAIGHLLELVVPEQFEVKRGKWSLTHLPVIPPHFDLKPLEKTEDRLKLLVRLMKRKDVTGIVNACDAGREGELIFQYILQHAGSKKPVERLWLQSMTPASIREGFKALRPDGSMRPLADAAMCRSESDWLVGINGTRAMTAFNSKDGGFYKTTVGRVQTPTLAILVEREKRIKAFVSRDYWELHGTFETPGGQYAARWIDENFERTKRADDADARAERLWDLTKAEEIRNRCLGKVGEVTEESRPSTQAPPLLYDLTSLQREANSRFGMSARGTLSIAQALYERHKVITYPRTDSRALPEDYVPTVHSTLQMLQGDAPAGERPRGRKAGIPPGNAAAPYAEFASRIMQSGWVRPNKRVFNNEKISDHFAIIPTLEAAKNLSEPEAKIYDLIVKRFLAVFYPAAEFQVTTRITRVEGEAFKSEGRVMINPGWLAVYGREADSGETPTLAPLVGSAANTIEVEVRASRTRPPARFSEATLLSAMEGAGKLVDDEELREAMEEKGLGTPATRASIIENLIQEEYVHRDGRELTPTAKAFDLLYALDRFGIDELRSPELTGTWEFKLKQIEQGRLARPEFMQHIEETARDLVERIRHGTHLDEPISTLAVPCPKCKGPVVENYRKFQCGQCDFSFWKVIASRRIENTEAEELIRSGSIGPLSGFRSRLGRPFAAMVKVREGFVVELDFGQSDADRDGGTPVDFSAQAPLGKCPKCGSGVYDHEIAYVCEKSVGPERTCNFRTGKIILQRPIEPDQVQKLLSGGRTDLLQRFISSKKGRPFSAFLVVKPDGGVGFEFAPRAPKAGTAAAGDGATPAPTAMKSALKTARKTATKSTPRAAKKTASRATVKAASRTRVTGARSARKTSTTNNS